MRQGSLAGGLLCYRSVAMSPSWAIALCCGGTKHTAHNLCRCLSHPCGLATLRSFITHGFRIVLLGFAGRSNRLALRKFKLALQE